MHAPRFTRLAALTSLVLWLAASFVPAEELWVAKALTPEGAFTAGIEGPNSDASGNVFVVNYVRLGTIARVTPEGQAEVFVDLLMGPTGKKSVANGIVFDRAGMMYAADYTNHNVLKIDPRTRQISVFAHGEFNQPNDLAIAPDDTIYCSDPDWPKGKGQIWHVDRAGKAAVVAKDLGTTNGIEVSPDGKTLYINESQQRGVWAFPILDGGKLGERKLIKQFDDHGFDGMRCDCDGNLYITRYGEGTVVKMTPQGEILKKIDVLGAAPSNLCFGGPDGRTVFVTEVKKTRLVSFRVDRPGLVWQRWQESAKK
jgi:sugar lactone lactonase YvrE